MKAFSCIEVNLNDPFNRVLNDQLFSEAWTCAKVSPIHKEGYLNKPCKYRSIAVLPRIFREYYQLFGFTQVAFFNIIKPYVNSESQCLQKRGPPTPLIYT